MNTGTDLLAAIAASPDDDTVRLAYTDWLDEQAGQLTPRAEFIRAQIRIEREPSFRAPEADSLRLREAALLAAHEDEWRRAGACPRCKAPGEEECPICFGTGDACGLTQLVVEHNGDGDTQERHRFPIIWRRGFPHRVTVPTLADVLVRVCSGCGGQGHITGTAVCGCKAHNTASVKGNDWARAVVWHHPTMQGFMPLDRKPSRTVSGWFWSKLRPNLDDVPHRIPDPVFGLLRGAELIPGSPGSTHLYALYPTLADAVDALADALGAVVRKGLENDRA